MRETLEQMEIQNVELDLAKSAPRKRRVLNPSFWQICHTSCVTTEWCYWLYPPDAENKI